MLMARRPISSLTVLDLQPEPALLAPLPAVTRGHRKDQVTGADRQSSRLCAALGKPARSSGLARGTPSGLGRAQAPLLLFKIKIRVDFGKAGPRPPMATGRSAKQAWWQVQRHPGACCQPTGASSGGPAWRAASSPCPGHSLAWKLDPTNFVNGPIHHESMGTPQQGRAPAGFCEGRRN